jgi:hypothetical protein
MRLKVWIVWHDQYHEEGFTVAAAADINQAKKVITESGQRIKNDAWEPREILSAFFEGSPGPLHLI